MPLRKAGENIELGQLVKLDSEPDTVVLFDGSADDAALLHGVALQAVRAGASLLVDTAMGNDCVWRFDGEGSEVAPGDQVYASADVPGDVCAEFDGGVPVGLARSTIVADAPEGALLEGQWKGSAAGDGGGSVVQSLQAAYNGGSTIECAAGDPVEITVDPTNFDALEIKADDANIGTISGFDGSGGLVLYGAADQGARIAVRTQTNANTGAAAVVSAGRGGPTAGTGGDSSVVGGQGGTTNGAGGEARVTGGLGAGTGAGGAAKLTGGGNGGTANGGAASVTGGASTGSSGTGGAASVTGGASTNGTGGSVAIDAGDGATDGNINIGTSKAVNTNVQAASAVAVKLQSQANGAIDVGVSSTNLRGADANAACITLSANGIGGAPKLSFFGAATVVQQATPVVLADVIALLQAYGLCP